MEHCSTAVKKPRKKSCFAKSVKSKIKDTLRQKMIAKHGIDVIDALDSIDNHYNNYNDRQIATDYFNLH